MLCPNIYVLLLLRVINVLESEHNTPNTWEMFWNQNTTYQTPEKYFGIKTQHTKRLRNVSKSKHNTSDAWEMFWYQNITHQTP